MTLSSVVFASGNQDKFDEIDAFLRIDRQQFKLVMQKEYGVDEIEETAETFLENALAKARHAAKVSGQAALGDDSGMIVNALGGAPGVYSARYAGNQASYRDNIDKVLQMMQGVPLSERRATYCCVLVLVRDDSDPLPLVTVGQWAGRIANDCPEEAQGFGYDPIFIENQGGQVVSTLAMEDKATMSHRNQALRQMLALMRAQGLLAADAP